MFLFMSQSEIIIYHTKFPQCRPWVYVYSQISNHDSEKLSVPVIKKCVTLKFLLFNNLNQPEFALPNENVTFRY